MEPGGHRVYAAFHDARLGDADVWVWASRDGGASFGPPLRVNDTEARAGRTQDLPRVAVAPGGRLDVVYYDRRADPVDAMVEAVLRFSDDGGRSFGRRLVLSDAPFDSRIGSGSERGMPELGSRLGLISTRDGAVSVWTDTRRGTEASNKQDLVRGVARFSPASPLRTPARALGLVVGLLGGLTLLSAATTGRRPRPLGRSEERASPLSPEAAAAVDRKTTGS